MSENVAKIGAGGRPEAARSRTINWGGVRLKLRTLSDVDRRGRAGRQAQEFAEALIADLGGEDSITTAQAELARSAALISAIVHDSAASYLNGLPVDLPELMAVVNTQRRLLATLGLERRARNVTPSVDAYLASRGEAA